MTMVMRTRRSAFALSRPAAIISESAKKKGFSYGAFSQPLLAVPAAARLAAVAATDLGNRCKSSGGAPARLRLRSGLRSRATVSRDLGHRRPAPHESRDGRVGTRLPPPRSLRLHSSCVDSVCATGSARFRFSHAHVRAGWHRSSVHSANAQSFLRPCARRPRASFRASNYVVDPKSVSLSSLSQSRKS